MFGVTTKDKAFIRSVADIPTSSPVGIRAGFGTLELYQQRYPQLQLVPFHDYEQGLLQVQARSFCTACSAIWAALAIACKKLHHQPENSRAIGRRHATQPGLQE